MKVSESFFSVPCAYARHKKNKFIYFLVLIYKMVASILVIENVLQVQNSFMMRCYYKFNFSLLILYNYNFSYVVKTVFNF